MGRLGFHVDRTITIEGPFDRHPYYADVKGAQATLETQVRRRLIGSPSLSVQNRRAPLGRILEAS